MNQNSNCQDLTQLNRPGKFNVTIREKIDQTTYAERPTSSLSLGSAPAARAVPPMIYAVPLNDRFEKGERDIFARSPPPTLNATPIAHGAVVRARK